MAFVTRITCSECDSQWIGPVNPFGPNVCATCLQTTLDKAEKTYFDKLEGLSIEERLTTLSFLMRSIFPDSYPITNAF